RFLKPFSPLAAILLLAVGCASTKPTENLLSAAGFQALNTPTPQQLERLSALPENTVTTVPKDGTNYFVFPVPGRKILYVGLEPQYREYQRLLQQQQAADAALGRARLMSSPRWTGWGAWDGPLITIPTPTSR
ncbi:MAG: hypothetical protein KIT22_14640, partial [Verrucomicrobiae bacterium]|nr:hypothetical protein [Verrucomicrobiae bacterium]